MPQHGARSSLSRPKCSDSAHENDRWSALEYACHVRDVFRIYTERLALMLDSDHPTFPNWDQDATAVEEHYNEQDSLTVASELAEAGSTLADAFNIDQWERRGHRSDGADFSVDTFNRYMVHDPIHHLHDVTTSLDSPAG